MTSAVAPPRRTGRKRRLTREDVVRAALSVVDSQGFQALSLRAVARELGVAPMTLYTYVEDSAELEALAIEALVAERTAGLAFPPDWQEALLLFADGLAALVEEHPAMLDAYTRGAVSTRSALRVAEEVLERLHDAGAPPDTAAALYDGVHALVLGRALLARSSTPVPPSRYSDLPRVAEALQRGRRLGTQSLRQEIELFLSGVTW